MMQSFYVGNFSDPSDHGQQPPLSDTGFVYKFFKSCLFTFFIDHICLLFSEPHPNAGPALPIIQGFSSPLIDMERNLALFLGLFNHTLYKSIPLDHEDIKVRT